jgi:hypothetical protein
VLRRAYFLNLLALPEAGHLALLPKRFRLIHWLNPHPYTDQGFATRWPGENNPPAYDLHLRRT